ncbi:HupE/UreJ family protein [Diaphorobacter aerolatus]|uniref:HupE/UreJ family protein n=1 Tax=Diaphorobacter aerolatus TaxID=1288495 RepID=A0A7H0GGD5_9BURK|nr:HupE/UreJ family protein [Diaphorobacter aerolatus]QNP47351.1 HupE/UreJ family protein [Diaphorobacter aerolatus]
MKKFRCLVSAAAAFAVIPSTVFAHVGDHGHSHNLIDSFTSAFAHPFTGADHLAAMVAVGMWSAIAVRPAWRAPVAFVALLIAGCVAGFAGLAVPGVEPMIAASVLVLGLLVAVQKRLPWGVAAGIAGVFAFFHGAAHGAELSADTAMMALAALIGMAAGSATLHLFGMGLGHALLQRHAWIARVGGAATALLGAVMLTRLV